MSSKATQESDISTKIMQENADLFADFLLSYFNEYVREGSFPVCLKKTDVTPIFKKSSKNSKGNYRSSQRFIKYLQTIEKPFI